MYVTTSPAELIEIQGEPKYVPVSNTGLLWISNTESDVFRLGKDGPVFYLVAGRWFKAPNLNGNWSFATPDLPEDFKLISVEHPRSRVLASVPGTQQAAEAVLLAQVPQLAHVNRNEIKAPDVVYQGEPQFDAIAGTKLFRATNTDKEIIKAGATYYMVRDVSARKLSEIALTQNEAQLARIIGSAMDAIITVDKNHKVVVFNASAERLFLCSAADALGQPLERFLPERFRNEHDMNARLFGQNEANPDTMGLRGDLYGLRASGEEFPIEASISYIDLNGQQFFTVIIRDITERKRAVDELRYSEERFAKAFRSNPQPMSLTTIAGGRYLDANDSFLQMSGYTRAEVIGHTSLELNIWETPEARAQFVDQLARVGSVVNLETKFRTKHDGALAHKEQR